MTANPEQRVIDAIDELVDWQMADSPAAHIQNTPDAAPDLGVLGALGNVDDIADWLNSLADAFSSFMMVDPLEWLHEALAAITAANTAAEELAAITQGPDTVATRSSPRARQQPHVGSPDVGLFSSRNVQERAFMHGALGLQLGWPMLT